MKGRFLVLRFILFISKLKLDNRMNGWILLFGSKNSLYSSSMKLLFYLLQVCTLHNNLYEQGVVLDIGMFVQICQREKQRASTGDVRLSSRSLKG